MVGLGLEYFNGSINQFLRGEKNLYRYVYVYISLLYINIYTYISICTYLTVID